MTGIAPVNVLTISPERKRRIPVLEKLVSIEKKKRNTTV